MKKDIEFHPVKNVLIAIVKETTKEDIVYWNVYIINKNEFPLENVLVTSKGYGIVNDEKRHTSALRHSLGTIKPKSFLMIEGIIPDLFQLTNQYFLSYFVGNQIFDKKYIFVPDSIVESNFTLIPLLNKQGILHE